MALMGRSRGFCIVHPGTEESQRFSHGEGHVEVMTSSHGSEFYDFDRVFGARTSQEKVFVEVARAPVLDALESFVSTIFLAFGPTGSGKTFAITGGAKRFADRGLIPRSISALFEALGARVDREDFEVSVSFYEIYKDAVVDLLHEKRKRVPVQQIESRGLVLEGLMRETAATESDAYHLLFQGDSNRHFERFNENPETSRGHVFYNLHLTHLPSGRKAALSFVDLAAVISTRGHATAAIERSLDAVKGAAAAICAGEQPIIDGQILTQLLQPVLRPDVDTMLPHLAVICPLRFTEQTAQETHEWLEFARQLREAFAASSSALANEGVGIAEAPQQLYVDAELSAPQLAPVWRPELQACDVAPMQFEPYQAFPRASGQMVSGDLDFNAVVLPVHGMTGTAIYQEPPITSAPLMFSDLAAPLEFAPRAMVDAHDPQVPLSEHTQNLLRDLHAHQVPPGEMLQDSHLQWQGMSSPALASQPSHFTPQPHSPTEYGPGMPSFHSAARLPSHGFDEAAAEIGCSITTLPPGQVPATALHTSFHTSVCESPASPVAGSVTLAQSMAMGYLTGSEPEATAPAFISHSTPACTDPFAQMLPALGSEASASISDGPPLIQVLPPAVGGGTGHWALVQEPAAATQYSPLPPTCSANFLPIEDPRAVVRAPYLIPNPCLKPMEGAPLLPQRAHDGIVPSLPLTGLVSMGAEQNTTPKVSGSYPGTLCVAPASASCFSGNSTPKLATESAAGLASNVPQSSELRQPALGSATPPLAAHPTLPSVPVQALTPNLATLGRHVHKSDGGSCTAPNFHAQSFQRLDAVPTPLRAGYSGLSSQIGKQSQGASLGLGPGPARSPCRSRAPGSSAPRSLSPSQRRVPGSPCASRSGSPLPQQNEMTGSARTNRYVPRGTLEQAALVPRGRVSSQPAGPAVGRTLTPPRTDVSPMRDGRPPRSLSPMPGRHQPIAPALQMAPSGAGAAWQFQATPGNEGTFVMPGMSGSAVRYARVSNPALQRSVSPQPGAHHHGDLAHTQTVPKISAIGDITGPVPHALSFTSARTAATSQRSTTPTGAHRGDGNCYSPLPRANYAYMGHVADVAPQQRANLPVASSATGVSCSGDADASVMASGGLSPKTLGNSFILTGGWAPESAAAPAQQLRNATSPQPSRPMSPMHSNAPLNHMPRRTNGLLFA